MAIIVDRMTPSDIDSVLEIERVSFQNPWNRDAFLYELKNRNARNYIIREDPAGEKALSGLQSVDGYSCFHVAADELHLLKMAIKPEKRKQSLAFHFLAACFGKSVEDAVEYAFLEVRESNRAAIRLYEKIGFRPVGVRPAYYPKDPGKRENAVIMQKILKGGNSWQ
ncbi:MAG: ribosomal protein S18-alanine N-acetyltransferase [Desulfosalsimonadaceae bacterium]